MPKPSPPLTAAELQRLIKAHPLITAGVKMADVGDDIWRTVRGLGSPATRRRTLRNLTAFLKSQADG